MAYTFKPYTESEAVQKAREQANKYSTYTESDAVKAARENANKYNTYTAGESVTNAWNKLNDYETNNNPGEWTGGNYKSAVENAFNAWNNREKFSYDLNGDALYQQYKDKYINQGRLAMADTIGQASAMTGGYGSSYAVTAGNQAYQSHLQNLNDIVPQLYQMAYDRYVQEGQDLKDSYSMASNMYNTEYGEYRDKVGDYNTTLDRLTNAYNNERAYDRGIWESDRDYANTLYNNERNYDYDVWDSNRTHATTVYDNERNYDYSRHNTEETNKFNAYTQDRNDYYQGEQLAISQGQLAVSQGQLKVQQDQLDFQKEQANKVVETEKIEGLSFDDANTLYEFADNENWDAVDKFIRGLNVSKQTRDELLDLWLPDDYGKPKVESNSTGSFWDNAKKVIYGANANIVYNDPRDNNKKQTFGFN